MGSWVWDVRDGTLTWSANLFRIAGLEPESLDPTMEDFFALVHPHDLERVQRMSAAAAELEQAPPMEYRLVRADGEVRHVLAQGRAARGADGELLRLVGTLTDISARQEQERELQRATRMLESAQEIANIGSWTWSPQDGEIRWTEQLYRITGVDRGEPLTIASFDELVHEDDRASLRASRARVLQGEDPSEELVTVRIVRPDGEVRSIEMSARQGPDGELAGVIMDVTERLRLERELRASRTLEATGRLAAGIAHDFNNLLTVVLANVAALAERAPSPELDEIGEAARSGAALVERLVAFGRASDRHPRVIELGALAADGVAWIQRVIGDDVVVEGALDGPVHVHADPSEIHRIMLNLALNARDAMPRGGTLRICLATEEGQAVLSFHDQGHGMSTRTLGRAAEPFFSTKADGWGAGLGLSTVYGIVRQLGGNVHLSSVPGRGTQVRLTLPLVAAPSAPRAAPAVPAPPAAGRTVLLVEDHPGVRRAIARQLQRAGHSVVQAGDAAEAVAALARAPVDIVVTDWLMPGGGGGGERVVDEVRSTYPAVPVLVITGHLPEGVEAGSPILEKPFAPAELLRRVAELTAR